MPSARTIVTTVLVALLAGCGSRATSGAAGTTTAAATTSVTEATLAISTFSFTPDPLAVAAGAVVVVTNGDPTTHTVTAGPPGEATGAFDVELAGKGATARIGPLAPGTYAYFCRVHPSMTGRFVVP